MSTTDLKNIRYWQNKAFFKEYNKAYYLQHRDEIMPKNSARYKKRSKTKQQQLRKLYYQKYKSKIKQPVKNKHRKTKKYILKIKLFVNVIIFDDECKIYFD